jgi:5-hydroxyisourate hydrolase-like protein (transthyretin family)
MPSISTHVLNSENGTHVAGLTVTLTHIESDGAKKNIFSSKTDAGGRILENFDFLLTSNEIFEIEFKLSDIHMKKKGIYCSDIIFRVSFSSENEKFHIPIIVSQNGASTWWSGE